MQTIDIDLQETTVQMADLSKELLVLRLAFGKLKAAATDAIAPISVMVTEGLQQATFAAIRLVKQVGAVIAALFGMENAQRAVTTAVSAAGKAVRRSLAGFDQLNRLDGGSAAGGTELTTVLRDCYQLTPELEALVARIRALLAPLQEIDLFPMRYAIAQLGEAFGVLAEQINTALQWVWYQLLAPFVTWVVESFAPMLMLTLRDALTAVSAVLTPLGAGFGVLLDAMQPVFQFIGSTVVTLLATVRTAFQQLGEMVAEKGGAITGIFQAIGDAFTQLWKVVLPILTALRDSWASTFSAMGQTAFRILGEALEMLYGVTEFLTGIFTGSWQRAWDGVSKSVKGAVNMIIGFLNLLLTGLSGAVNGVVRAVNQLRFTVPSWVPGLGGQTFGFHLSAISVPKIPYLAQGAVLPANRPFLAMVGDQRHGTNVEAPLTTIQEAVAQVLGDRLEELAAPLDAAVLELQRLHDTVSQIEVGDAVIGKAVDRYRQKMAVVHGRSY